LFLNDCFGCAVGANAPTEKRATMTDDRLTRNLKLVALTLLSLALAAIVYLFLGRIKLVVVILIGAIFFAYLIYPAVRWLQSRRFPRWAAISSVYLGFVVVIGTTLAFAGPVIGEQARNLALEFPTFVTETHDAIVNANSNVLDAVPIEARTAVANGLENLVSQAQSAAGDFAGQAFRLVASLASFMAASILVPLLAFYILLDLDHLREMIVGLFPLRHRERAFAVLGDVDSVVGGFIRGQLIVGAIVACLVTLMLLFFRVKYALLIGLFAGVVDIIPYVGAVAGAIPAVLLAAFEHGPLVALGLAFAFFLLYELEGHIIAPAIVSQRVGLTPLLVIVSILIGAELGGIGGMFLSVPIAGIIKVLWKRFMLVQVVQTPPEQFVMEKTETAG
jgi:predicted PurR-regulated permease PerM